MLSRASSVIGVIGLGAVLACGDAAKDGEAAPPLAAEPGAQPQAFADVVTIDQVAVYQAVKVTFVEGAQTVVPNAPVIPKRPALIRLGTKVPARVKTNKLVAELRVRASGRPDVVLKTFPRQAQSFDEGALDTSFNWELGADQVLEGATITMEIRDPSGADPSTLRYPATGELALNVAAFEPKLRVRFVPIEYRADGSNRIPSMDKATVDAYRSALYRMYPVTQVDVSVRDVVPWPLEVRGDGTGWSELLDAVIETRQDDQVADDVYYVGVFTPAEHQYEYCQGGCILGIAPAMTLGEAVALRTAMIVGYHSPRQHGTLAQELAHAMGRNHAPCGGPSGIDKKYPYSDASIGTWGWDVQQKALISPDDRFDFMSYCSPVWVSDYTYGAIYNRMLEVDREKRPGVGEPERQPMKTYHVGKDGSVRAGPTVMGVPRLADELAIEGSAHETIGKVRGAFLPLSNVGGGILVTPTEIPAATLNRARFARTLY